MQLKRVPSGIPGLDKLIEGGFIEGSTILVSGTTGSGKTTFALQFLWEGVKKGEKCLYISLEEDENSLKDTALQYGWKLDTYIKRNKLKLLYISPSKIMDITKTLNANVTDYLLDIIEKEKDISRLVIDSIAVLGMYYDSVRAFRKDLFKIGHTLKKKKCTSILISEILEGSEGISRFNVEEFVADGVILLYYSKIAGRSFGSIEVRKMRHTDHRHGLFEMNISKKGIVVDWKSQTILMK